MSATNFMVIQSSAAWAMTPLSQEELKYAYATVSGTIADPEATITVNGIPGTNYGNGFWEVFQVPLPPGKGSNRRLEFELCTSLVHPGGFMLWSMGQMMEQGFGPFGRADLHARRNPLHREGRLTPQARCHCQLAGSLRRRVAKSASVQSCRANSSAMMRVARCSAVSR